VNRTAGGVKCYKLADKGRKIIRTSTKKEKEGKGKEELLNLY
jgi:hypothetical protein